MTLLTYKGRKHLPVYKKQTGKKTVCIGQLILAHAPSSPCAQSPYVAINSYNIIVARAKKVAFK